MSFCTSGVGFQVLPLIDNMHLGSILSFQQYSCFIKEATHRYLHIQDWNSTKKTACTFWNSHNLLHCNS